jgi:hydrogenase/urease accessory protein HupE
MIYGHERLAARLLAVLLLGTLRVGEALGHEVRPALLQIVERDNGHYDVLWKQPTDGEVAVHLVPRISGALLERVPTAVDSGEGFQLRAWRDIDAGAKGLNGREISVDGLDRTITDVVVSITRGDGDTSQQLIRPQSPTLRLNGQGSGASIPSYVALGVEHILTGVDHLCFVFGLILLVRKRGTLIATITAFTAAHSVTLAATTFHIIVPRAATVEALVALSIVFIAIELFRSRCREQSTLTLRRPWLIASIFGLLHGTAFASSLVQIGLPRQALPLCLFLFNLGVEIGQVLFVAVVLAAAWMARWLLGEMLESVRWVPSYTIGSFAVCWFIQRLVVALN